MDVVDIDKVLDDLELNEGERTAAAAAAAAAENKGKSPWQRKPDFPSLPASERNNNKGGANSKTFINITNVFSSLNEYVNVDIEHSVRGAANAAAAEPDHSQAYQAMNDGDNEEEERTDDDTGGADGAMTSASSLTTSSPSSFSSGPSPGSASESASYLSEEKFYAPAAGLDNRKTADVADGTDSQRTNLIEDKERGVDDGADLDMGNENNSGELGLSSISSCLYNENTSSSLPGLSHDLIKINALSSMSSSSSCQSTHKDNSEPTIDQQAHVAVEGAANTPEVVQTKEQAAAQNNQPIVIGFGSTMDEISDTELDSMLQEIDDTFNGTATVETFAGSQKTSSKRDEIEDGPAVQLAAALQQQEPAPQSAVKKPSDPDDDENLPNADSFSQASTVEFAESRLQSDFGIEVMSSMAAAAAAAVPHDEQSTSSNSGTRNDEATNPIDPGKALLFPKIVQRPNSLNLPVQSMEINSTAGQTPPASRLGDDDRANGISTSSSDGQSPNVAAAVVAPPPIEPDAVSTAAVAATAKLGKVPPFWIPDSDAPSCMQCKLKFSLLKRRHHCRACGQVLCSACCSQKRKLEFLGEMEVRICVQCHLILSEQPAAAAASSGDHQPDDDESDNSRNRSPNPNNPMEYCSMIPPHQQVAGSVSTPNPISVMVPVGVLKREGVPSKSSRKDKNVIFSDGIRPGCDLAELDDSWDEKGAAGSAAASRKASLTSSKRLTPGTAGSSHRSKIATTAKDEPRSYIPDGPNELPPIYTKNITNTELSEVKNNAQLIARLQTETLQFAIQRNLYVYVKITKLKCCINKTVINFTTRGMNHVGQDDIVILLEYDEKSTTQPQFIPQDIFVHLNEIYRNADKGHPITELGYSVPSVQNFLESREHGGFLYIRATFQCLQEINLPDAPFLIGILIHRWEMPWAKIFPLRLMLRLGAQYRYYPSPHVSIRFRESVYAEIAQTIINFLADFRNYSYTLATIRGMYIHMEDRKTTVLLPKNRFDQIVKALNNSSDHILALGANFSKKADGHLVCIQNMESDTPETHTYSTQAINIQGQPRKVTGASFVVFNGALKSTSGLSGKCSIVEDGLMVQILPAKMTQVRNSLKNSEDIEILCGPVDANESQTEVVSIQWIENDVEFNMGVKSPIDEMKMDGIPSIRVHSSLNYSNSNHLIRWTEVFIIQDDFSNGKDQDMSKLAEQIAQSTSTALVSFLDLLVASGCVKIGLRATLHHENVCYEAGSLNSKLAPLYMNALDNELIPTLHRQTTNLQSVENPIVLELIFHILDF